MNSEHTSRYEPGASALATILCLSTPATTNPDRAAREWSVYRTDRGFSADQLGVFVEQAMCVLLRAGVPATALVAGEQLPPDTWLQKRLSRTEFSAGTLLGEHLWAGGTAIVAVPCLNNQTAWRWIVVSRGRVVDPSPGLKYGEVRENGSFATVAQIGGAVLLGAQFGHDDARPPTKLKR
jgi:hypothetical protein